MSNSSTARQLTTIQFGQEQVPNNRIINEAFIRNAFDMNGLKFASLPISQMTIDEDYQRPPQRKINKIAKEWDIAKCRVIEVSFRDNQFYVVDGQNRYLAAKQVGEDFLPCMIYLGLTKELEALIFADQDENKTRVSTVDKFKAKVTGLQESEIAIKAVCDDFGIGIGTNDERFTSSVKSVATLHRMWRTGKEIELRWAFNIIKESGWHTAKNAYSDEMLSVLNQMYICNRRHSDEVKPMIVNLLSQTSPDMLAARAQIAYSNHGRRVAVYAYIDRYLSQYREGVITI